MGQHFRGAISGAGLDQTFVEGEFEETTGDPAPPRHGWFGWAGMHEFQSGQVYQLEIAGPHLYSITITDIRPGSIIEFATSATAEERSARRNQTKIDPAPGLRKEDLYNDCPVCHGQGVIPVTTSAGVVRGPGGTVTMRQCQHCSGKGVMLEPAGEVLLDFLKMLHGRGFLQ